MKSLYIQKALLKLQPKLQNSQQLALAIEKQATKHSIDWKLITAIMFQESSLRLDPQNCLAKSKRCQGDYGIGQVRYSVWKTELNLDKERMLTDLDYSVKVSVKVLADYKRRYSKKEANWYTRYHSGTPEHRANYAKKIYKVYEKIGLTGLERSVASKD